jgi:hypothetical protein
MLFGVTQAGATVYSINETVGTGGVTGFIRTDGTIGALVDANITDWNLVISTDPLHTLNLLGPLSGNNSQEGIFGPGLSATATGLFYDFSLPPTDFVLIQNPVLFSGTNFICLNGCAADVAIGVGDFRAFADVTTAVTQIGSATPLPAALPLFVSAAGVIGFAARRKKSKAAVAA